MNRNTTLAAFLLLFSRVLVLADTISFTESKPANTWDRKNFDASGWKNVSSWQELSPQVKGEVWIRVEQSYPIKELNNLVVEGELAGELAMSINGRKTHSIFKRNGIYYLTGAEITAYWHGFSSYSTVAAMSTNIYGPYGNRYFAYPCAGHSCIFQTTNNQRYATSFTLPGKSMYPGIFPVEFDANNRLVLPKSVGVPFDAEMARQEESSYQ